MTIVYKNKKFPPPPFDREQMNMTYYRALYNGDHEMIFPRAQELYDSDKVTKQYRLGPGKIRRWRSVEESRNSMHHYVVVNLSAVIAESPADLINRSLGNISADEENNKELLSFIERVNDDSSIQSKIWPAVVQHQVDGIVAYRIRRDAIGKTWIEWRTGDVFFPHDDDLGVDFAWVVDHGEYGKEDKYLRVERQRIDHDQLTIDQLVFSMRGDEVGDEMDIKVYAESFGEVVPESVTLPGVTELMCGYVVNDETLLHPRGRSALRNIDTIQEEINWTITRDSIVFEKHGKPKLAIPRGLWDSVANDNASRYGQRFVRNADLEVVSYNENNGAIPLYITWDAQTSQSFEHVKRLIKYMMAASKTSLQAVGLEEGGGNKSAVAILYEWIQSVIKAEAIKDKFDVALKDAFRKCVIMENALSGANYDVKNPVIEWGDMLPKADSERDTEEADKYSQGVQSLETTVRRLHPDWSEEAIEEEIQKIQDEKSVGSLNPQFTQPPRVTIPTGDQQ